jgi:molybdate transport system substrate-binding protein
MSTTLAALGMAPPARYLSVLAVIAACMGAPAAANADEPVVAAAAGVRFALQDVVQDFYLDTGQRVRLTLGSSGNLARQIREGAPYQVYLSADPGYVSELAGDGLTRDAGKDYLMDRLAIIVPPASPLAVDGSLDDLRRALGDGRLKRFAIANPEHAPYGQRAEQVLRRAGLWEAISAHLVLGENVGQAAQFAVSGNAQGGIIGFALARAPAIAARGSAALIPAQWHDPLRHRAVLLKSAGPVAQQFFTYLSTASAGDRFRQHGFHLPGDPD